MGLTMEDVAERAEVDVAYVRRLGDLGALGPERDGYREQDVHVTALLHMWEEAGLTAESILTAAEAARIGPAELQGVATPVTLYRASRRGSHRSA